MFPLVLLALVAQAFAGEHIDARCPVVRPTDNFDYASFSNGLWYEVARYDNRKEKGTECSYTKYTPMGDRFKIESVGLRHNKKYELNGYGKLAPDAGNTGKLIYTLPYGKNGQNTDSILNVMSTDNANYAVLYHCNYNEETKTKQELSWIVSRTKTLRSDFKALIDRYLLESKVLDLSKYIFPNFSDDVCRIDF
ncbi:unnamed protein product [Danaus chrysippus]|uniref:(African queen) hypothetical protein n=1 Tax=Danaus chrysippus TaxID=151541 RepID=A0A8J2QM31_9NEOP|nr:unnamed protein product [Danaus chrysippus]